MSGVSRRDVLCALFGRSRPTRDSMPTRVPATAERPSKALILDRYCLAHQGSFCSVCREHCPVEGAIVISQGRPRVDPDPCTGCGKCQAVCPAPRNAVFLVDSAPRPGMIAVPAPVAS